jgi:hypothetical protein
MNRISQSDRHDPHKKGNLLFPHTRQPDTTSCTNPWLATSPAGGTSIHEGDWSRDGSAQLLWLPGWARHPFFPGGPGDGAGPGGLPLRFLRLGACIRVTDILEAPIFLSAVDLSGGHDPLPAGSPRSFVPPKCGRVRPPSRIEVCRGDRCDKLLIGVSR